MRTTFPSAFRTLASAAVLSLVLTGCKSSQDKAIQAAKQRAAQTGQEQQVVSTDTNGNTVTTTIEPPAQGSTAQTVTTTTTPKGQTPPAAPQAQMPADGSGTPSAPAPAAATPAPTQAAAPTPAPAPQIHVSAGTTLAIRIDHTLSSRRSHVGERFTGEIVEAVKDSSGQPVIPRGSDVTGKVVAVKAPGRFKGAGTLSLRLTSLKVNGKSYPLDTSRSSANKKGKGKRTAAFIGGGGGLGAIIGGAAGGGTGALIGGLAGAGAGTAGAGLTGNRDLVIPAESTMRFKLTDELVIQP